MVLVPTILCGGAGSRLWPVSREFHPKPFIRLADGNSLLQKAFLRGAALPEVSEFLTVTNRNLIFKIVEEYKQLEKPSFKNSYILEPFARNTAAAITAAALYLSESVNPNCVMLVLAADHLIQNQVAFNEVVLRAIDFAKSGKLVTFGIQPNTPETGYGYIEAEANRVLRFVEKPTLEKAQEYLESGRYLWNSGIFCFTPQVFLAEMQKHCPEILTATRVCMQNSLLKNKEFSQLELEPVSFSNIPELSIDYALMEKSDELVVVPCDIGWNDIGSWSALSGLSDTDIDGNSIRGEAVLHQVKDCFIHGDRRMIGAVGVNNLIVVDTPDALLIADKSCAQEVKHIYANLKLQSHEAHKLHRTVHRPWGDYTVLEEASNFKIKRLVVKPGASLSLQKHQYRSEHWVVVSGVAKVTNGDLVMTIQVNESTFIPAGNKHRLENPSSEDLIIIEVQSGSYVGEDDIVRLEDVYGRIEEVV